MLGVLALFVFGGLMTLGRQSPVTTTSAPSSEYVRQIRPLDSYYDIDVRELDKNAERYVGQLIHLRGEVFNINEDAGGTFLQMNVRKPRGSAYDTVPVMVSYDSALPGIYEDSQVDVYGMCGGTQSGTNSLGGAIEQPLIFADIVQ